jgi:serine acetyltransferase
MRAASKNGGYVGRETHIESMPNLPHGFHGIHISRLAWIGNDVTIYQNVTIGAEHGGGPHIEDGVMIGANAVIIGAVNVGRNSKIGAGAIVVDDVPENATVVSPKAKVI